MWNGPSVTNTLAYYGTELITSVKRFKKNDMANVIVKINDLKMQNMIIPYVYLKPS